MEFYLAVVWELTSWNLLFRVQFPCIGQIKKFTLFYFEARALTICTSVDLHIDHLRMSDRRFPTFVLWCEAAIRPLITFALVLFQIAQALLVVQLRWIQLIWGHALHLVNYGRRWSVLLPQLSFRCKFFESLLCRLFGCLLSDKVLSLGSHVFRVEIIDDLWLVTENFRFCVSLITWIHVGNVTFAVIVFDIL